MSEGTGFHKAGWIHVNPRKTKPVLDSDIYYVDFGTYIEGIHKETDRPEPLQPYPKPIDLEESV